MVYQHPHDYPVRHRFLGVEAIECANWQINAKDKFNLGYLYAQLKDWAVESGWAPRSEIKFPETLYVQRESSYGKEMRIRWRLHKDPGDKTKLFTYKMDLDFYFLGIKDAEIVYKGRKIKTNKGSFELITKGWLIIDAEKKWGKGIWASVKKRLLQKELKNKRDYHFGQVYQQSYALRDFVMRYFKLEPAWLGGATPGFEHTRSID
ncbi:hypothetical protein D6825_03260 [Candidatus Woesearchaeota archaeon]|nr:MAG: hypothetical protein D6825_03260 [Candidatus Woesearchaeota archaeon]